LDTTKVGFRQGVVVNTSVPVASEARGDVLIHGTRILEKTASINEGIGAGKLAGSTEGVDRVGEGINGIGVVEGLGTKDVEEGSTAKEGRTVINVLVRLDNPDKLLHGVVEVELDLVGGGTNRLVTSELKLGNQILVRILGETAALVRVQEDVVNVQGSRNKGLIVGNGGADGGADGVLVGRVVEVRTSGGGLGGVAAEGCNGPQALINRAEIKVNLDLVVLKGNQRKGKTRVGAEPELERHVKGGLGKSIAGSANLARSHGVTRSINIREGRVSDEGKLSGVTNHLEVTTLLLGGHGKLVPDVHPVTILTVNALTTNLNLNLSNELLTGVI